MNDLREQYERETGRMAYNVMDFPLTDYAHWLEAKILADKAEKEAFTKQLGEELKKLCKKMEGGSR